MRIGRSLLLLILCLVAAQAAHAEVSLNLDSSSETGGVWTYNYSIDNTDGSGWVYDVFLNTVDPVTVAPSPSGWTGTYSTGTVNWHTESSLAPGSPVLSGFAITSRNAPATVSWTIDIGAGVAPTIDGNVSGPGAGGSTPEPMSLCLLGLAMGPVLVWGRRRRGRLEKK